MALVTDEYGSVTGPRLARGPARGARRRDRRRVRPRGARVRASATASTASAGKTSIDDVNELLDVELPDEEWDTVAGLVLDLLRRIPEQGEEVRFDGLAFRAENVAGPPHRERAHHAGPRVPRPSARRGSDVDDARSTPAPAIDELVAAAREVRARAYAPYSGFHVGAALLAGDEIFTGGERRERELPAVACAPSATPSPRRWRPASADIRAVAVVDGRRRAHPAVRRVPPGPVGVRGRDRRDRRDRRRSQRADLVARRTAAARLRPGRLPSRDRLPLRAGRRGRPAQRRQVHAGERAGRGEGRDRLGQAADDAPRTSARC